MSEEIKIAILAAVTLIILGGRLMRKRTYGD